MPESPKHKPRRRWLQFSLRTFLVASTLAALGIWWGVSWYRGLGPLQTKLPGGLVLWEEAQVERKDEFGQLRFHSSGRFTITDDAGHVWCRGRFDEGQATGRWTWFHANGRAALSGDCARDFRAWVWIAHTKRGYKTLELPHGSPREVQTRMRHKWRVAKYSNRDGIATEYHASGRPSASGAYASDCREGPWTFWDDEGRKTAEGEYLAGMRHGKWTIFGAPDGKPFTTYFVSDLEIPDLPARIAKLAGQLDSADWQVRADAVEALGAIGPLAVPELRRALSNADPDVVLRALDVLTFLGVDASAALPDIRRLAQSASTGKAERAKAFLTLFTLDEPARDETLQALLALADLQDDEACQEVHMQIALFGAPVLSHLAQALDSQDPSLRVAALDVLACMLWPFDELPWPFPEQMGYFDQLKRVLERACSHVDPVIAKGAEEVLKYLANPMLPIRWRKYEPLPYRIPVVG